MTMSFLSPLSTRRLNRRKLSLSVGDAPEYVAGPNAASTPYNTPFKYRNKSICRPNLQDDQVKKALTKLKNLVNKQWYTFNVSPLFNMCYSEVSLKRYSRRLKEKLMSRLSDQSAIEYEVVYSKFINLQLNNVDHEAIQISVEKMQDSGKRSAAYTGILLSWGATRNMQPHHATFLPILICKGLKTVIKQIHTEFQLLHDCFVSPFDIHDEELRMLCVGILGSSSYAEDSTMKLRYNLPPKIQSGHLDISLPTSMLTSLWKSIHRSNAKQWTDTELNAFWNELHSHTSRSFGIDLSRCGLAKVSLPDIAFTQDAMLAKSKEQMYIVLCFLMNMHNISLSSVAPAVHAVVVSE